MLLISKESAIFIIRALDHGSMTEKIQAAVYLKNLPEQVPGQPTPTNKSVIDEMVNRFLCWKLPADFAPDAGISFDLEANTHMPPEYRHLHAPTGTNLFTADQAKAMLMHVVAGLIEVMD